MIYTNPYRRTLFFWAVVLLRLRKRHTVPAEEAMQISLLRSALFLLVLVGLHVSAMYAFEGISLGDGLWLTATTITTVGYGDISAATPLGRTATVVLLYFGGIFVLGKVAGDYFDYRAEKRFRKIRGEWYWNMSRHILIINCPNRNSVNYFKRLISQFRQSDRFGMLPIQILTTNFEQGLPDSLSKLDQVVHFHGQPINADDLVAVNADEADVVAILANDEYDDSSDSRTFDTLHRLKDMGCKAQILAECVDETNRQRLLDAGAHMVTRPMRAYPEMIVRGFVAPGSEQVIENLFTSANDEYQRFDLMVDNLTWLETVTRIMAADLGTPVAFIEKDGGKLITNPAAKTQVVASAIIVMVREDNNPTEQQVAQALEPAL